MRNLLFILFAVISFNVFGQHPIVSDPVSIYPSNRNKIIEKSLQVGDGTGADSIYVDGEIFMSLDETGLNYTLQCGASFFETGQFGAGAHKSQGNYVYFVAINEVAGILRATLGMMDTAGAIFGVSADTTLIGLNSLGQITNVAVGNFTTTADSIALISTNGINIATSAGASIGTNTNFTLSSSNGMVNITGDSLQITTDVFNGHNYGMDGIAGQIRMRCHDSGGAGDLVRVEINDSNRVQIDVINNVVNGSNYTLSGFEVNKDTMVWYVGRNIGSVAGVVEHNAYLDTTGLFKVESIKISDGATNGYELISDAGGNATWTAPKWNLTGGDLQSTSNDVGIVAGGNQVSELYFTNDALAVNQTGIAYDSLEKKIFIEIDNTSLFFIDSGGTASFGLANPDEKFTVNGSSEFLDSMQISGGLTINSTTQAFIPPRMNATQASAITPADGMVIYVNNTNATFTQIGFWCYENGLWGHITATAFAFMGFSDSSVTVAGTQNVYSKVTNASNTLWSHQNVSSSGVNIIGDSITVTTAGIYKIIWSLSFSGTNTDHWHITPLINGVPQYGCGESDRELSQTKLDVATSICRTTLSANDVLTLGLMNEANNNDALINSGSLDIEKK